MQAVTVQQLWGPEAPSAAGGLPVTHEAYIHSVAALARARIEDAPGADRLAGVKIVFGTGSPGVRGTCYYGAWTNGRATDLVEVCAFGRESDTQLAGTTIHELGHVLAEYGAGHGKAWKDACKLLGLTTALAEGQQYAPEHFDPDLWAAVQALPKPTDGLPNPTRAGVDPLGGLLGVLGFRGGRGGGCRAGQGTRGGRSTGPGSGRNRLWVCKCGVRVRVASDDFKAQCLRCESPFERGTPAGPTGATVAQPPAPPLVEPPMLDRCYCGLLSRHCVCDSLLKLRQGGGTDPAPQGGGGPEKGALT